MLICLLGSLVSPTPKCINLLLLSLGLQDCNNWLAIWRVRNRTVFSDTIPDEHDIVGALIGRILDKSGGKLNMQCKVV